MFVERTIITEGYNICFVQSLKIDFFLQQKKRLLFHTRSFTISLLMFKKAKKGINFKNLLREISI